MIYLKILFISPRHSFSSVKLFKVHPTSIQAGVTNRTSKRYCMGAPVITGILSIPDSSKWAIDAQLPCVLQFDFLKLRCSNIGERMHQLINWPDLPWLFLSSRNTKEMNEQTGAKLCISKISKQLLDICFVTREC